jgi:CO/xanthine dehydrogenase Mo-binding subunit
MARALQIPAGNVEVKMDHIGGGFGSKFPVDRWGLEATKALEAARRSADQADARA